MSVKTYKQDWLQYKTSEVYQQVNEISYYGVKLAVLNNDRLLKDNGVTLAAMIRLLEAKGVYLNRKYYEKIRRGNCITPKVNWLSYLVYFWNTFYNYSLTIVDLFNPDFITKIKPERDAAI